jgi:hypothetical protein
MRNKLLHHTRFNYPDTNLAWRGAYLFKNTLLLLVVTFHHIHSIQNVLHFLCRPTQRLLRVATAAATRRRSFRRKGGTYGVRQCLFTPGMVAWNLRRQFIRRLITITPLLTP